MKKIYGMQKCNPCNGLKKQPVSSPSCAFSQLILGRAVSELKNA